MCVALVVLLIGFGTRAAGQRQLYAVSKGSIDFNSEAPKELISAISDKLTGIVDNDKKTFAFRVDIISFHGFNSPLQREHFNENYLESSTFPEATFTGKILEDISLLQPGTYKVRAKGRLNVHGIDAERIVPVEITVKGTTVTINANFAIALADHNIKIPRVVYDKLAPDINVHVHATLQPRRS